MRAPLTIVLLCAAVASCGDRAKKWEAIGATSEAIGLSESVALIDHPLNRVVLLRSDAEYELLTLSFGVGRNIASTAVSADGNQLFVLSRGVQPRRKPSDELPSLSVIDGGEEPSLWNRYELSDPKLELAVDPLGSWLVAYGGDSTVTNPNEFIFFDLDDKNDEGTPVTIRSQGGVPEQVLFTEPLVVPEGPARRFAVIRTDRDITLIDLANLSASEITISTPVTSGGVASRPMEVVVDPGAEESDDDPGAFGRFAVRLGDQADVMLLELGETLSEGRDFTIRPNLVDVGGVPSAIEFVRTDFGLRLAALVPSRSEARLIDPETTVVETVAFPKPYSQLRRVTDAAPEQGELALLYSPQTTGFAFWSLGTASGSPFRSVEQNEVDLNVANVRDVPGEEFAHLKILESSGQGTFFVLDLEKRQTFPMLTAGAGFTINVSSDGKRAWAYRPKAREFARVNLADLHPQSLSVALPVIEVHDIARKDGSRAALALHGIDGSHTSVGVTLLDAEDPDSADTRYFEHILLGDL